MTDGNWSLTVDDTQTFFENCLKLRIWADIFNRTQKTKLGPQTLLKVPGNEKMLFFANTHIYCLSSVVIF